MPIKTQVLTAKDATTVAGASEAIRPFHPTGVVGAANAALSPAGDTTNRKNMALLIQLRWIAVVGQVVTIAFVHLWLGVALPLGAMAAVLCALILFNVASLV